VTKWVGCGKKRLVSNGLKPRGLIVMTMDRSAVLFGAVSGFNDIHNDWANARENSARYPTLAYWRSFNDMVNLFQSGNLPADCRQLSVAVFNLAKQSVEFDISDSPEPPSAFWHAREHLEDIHIKLGQPGEPVYRESIKELDKQVVPHEQIARMWGLRNADGTGRPHLVQQELDNPGSVIGPDYIHPDDVEAGKDAEEARRTYQSMRDTMTSAAAEAAAESQPCPETSQELWLLPGMTIRQAAKMLQRTEDDVAAEWQTFEAAKNAGDNEGGTEAPSVSLSRPMGLGVAEVTMNTEADTVDLGSDTVDLGSDTVDLGNDTNDDKYSQFSEWDYQQLRLHAREELKIQFKGSPKREWLIDQILSLETVDSQ